MLKPEGNDITCIVYTDVFNKFKDKTENKFSPTLGEDREGLMELFEASQVSIEGEHILEEAEEFSCYHLKELANRLSHHQARAIQNTLQQPYRKSVARLTATNFLEIFQAKEKDWMRVLQQVAKTDYKIVQSIHENEIVKVSE